MDMIKEAIMEWLKEILVGGIVSNLSGMFDSVNTQVGEIAGQIGMTPQGWNGNIFNMVRSLSETVILPIAGVILAFVMTLELIQLISDRNNLHDVDTWMFFKWIFKTACAILIVTNTWNIVMKQKRCRKQRMMCRRTMYNENLHQQSAGTHDDADSKSRTGGNTPYPCTGGPLLPRLWSLRPWLRSSLLS